MEEDTYDFRQLLKEIVTGERSENSKLFSRKSLLCNNEDFIRIYEVDIDILENFAVEYEPKFRNMIDDKSIVSGLLPSKNGQAEWIVYTEPQNINTMRDKLPSHFQNIKILIKPKTSDKHPTKCCPIL